MKHRSLSLLTLFLGVISSLAGPAAAESTTVTFKEPHLRGYIVESQSFPASALQARPQWLRARPEQDPDQTVELGSRLLLRTAAGADVNALMDGSGLEIAKTMNKTTFVLQAVDANSAMQQANRLSGLEAVVACVPVMRRPVARHSAFNDPYLDYQWNFSQRDTNGAPLGVDLNLPEAWQITRGNGVKIAIADDGVELSHPELSARAANMPHYNFVFGTANGNPVSNLEFPTSGREFGHGTSVAGMAVAEADNGIGIVGAAPEAKFASWVIFSTNVAGNAVAADTEQLMEMFQFKNNTVPVQNHSWGNEKTAAQFGVDFWAEQGIANAIANGRGGRGIVMVRSVGNYRNWTDPLQPGRTIFANANDDGYPADRRVVSVAAVNANGRATRYSNPGACILVAAPTTESQADGYTPDLTLPSLFMVDRQGARGYNTATDELGDYCYSNNIIIGTSFGAPQISGIVAMMLNVNTNLTYRDAQQILVLSARHLDLADPDVKTNAAGLVVSHNVGFGIPDAGVAVRLAQSWVNRPALSSIGFTNEHGAAVVDDGLRVIVNNAPINLQTIPGSPSMGVHPDEPTSMLPLVDVGFADTAIGTDLTGKGALIERGGPPGTTFALKIQNAASAGAAFAIIYNNTRTPERLTNTYWKVSLPMTGTDFSPIPAVFIGKDQGDALRNLVATNGASAQLKVLATNYTFTVTNTLLCEHIAVDVDGDNITSPNGRRGDIRITLTSPSGTRSVLQRMNTDTNRLTSPAWTYHSTHHFYEGSAGQWTVSISDQAPGATATIRSVALRIFGTQLNDSDNDGLDDQWETTNFGSLAQGPQNDPDNDGFSNIREQVMGSPATAASPPVIVHQPQNSMVRFGGNVTFNVLATSWSPLGFQWQHNSTNISGATSSSLTISDADHVDGGVYSVIVTNQGGSIVSSDASLSLYTCNFNVAGMTQSTQRSALGGEGTMSFYLAFSNDCPWSIVNTNDWITITSPLSGNGDSFVRFVVAPNTNTSARFGEIRISDETAIMIHQTGTIVPNSIIGKTFTLSIDQSTGSITTNGTFLVNILSETFRIVPLTANVEARTGIQYSWPGFMTNGWHINLVEDGATSASPSLSLEFTTPTSGTFVMDNRDETAFYGTFNMLESGADFDDNGRPDLVLQHTDRRLSAWVMNGQEFLQARFLRGGTPIGPGWKAVGVADFNRDDYPDVLFQHETRKFAIWLMQGTNYIRAIPVRSGTPAAAGWKGAGSGDFNNDGWPDILMQHTDGRLATWLITHGTNFIRSSFLREGKPVAAGFLAAGAGDFNRDGKTDVLLQHRDTAKLLVWHLDGVAFLTAQWVRDGNAPKNGSMASAIADLNGDGRNDIIFQNAKRELTVWYLNETLFEGAAVLRPGKPAGDGWQLFGPR